MNTQPSGSDRAEETRAALHQLLDLLADRVAERLINKQKKRAGRPATTGG
jgi:hypothetical protein